MKPIHVMLVEDSEADQFLFEAVLEESYADIFLDKACDGEQAQQILLSAEALPKIIFLDINMPKMNGYEFLESSGVLLYEKDISVYMLTSSAREQDLEKAMSYSCVKGYIEKPCTQQSLASALNLH